MKTILLIAFILVLISASKISQQTSLAVTIYNDDFAMVKDVRQIQFQKGNSFLYFTDVSASIQTETVTFKPLDTKANIRIYEQNFEKNLFNQNALLQKFLEKQIKLVVRLGDVAKSVKGTLLGYDSEYIIKTNSGINVFNKIESIQFPQLPQGFFTKPTLNWKVFSEKEIKTQCEVAYRTTGFRWKADYSITLDENQKLADIGGWVTIDNNSGKKYVNAKLKLIAGDVNTVQQSTPRAFMAKNTMVFAAPMAAPQFSEKSFADYHLYTLSQTVTLNQSSQKQIEFIKKVYDVPLRKYHKFQLNVGGNELKNMKPTNKIEFINSKKIGLGIPLPKGTVRVFKRDTTDGSLEFIGEDEINHTPKDENISLTTGTAFDIVANVNVESKQTFKNGGYRANMNITITNHKQTSVEVEINLNNMYGDNLSIKWNSDTPLLKQSGINYKVKIQTIGPNSKWTAKWQENYFP